MTTVTTPEHDTAPPAADPPVLPPAAAAVVDTTDWAALRHAFGPAVDCPPHDGEPVADVPDLLRAVLDPDARTAAQALDALTLYAVDEEGDVMILSFVPPVARFAAALLDDPRTLLRIPHLWGPPGRDQPLRTALLALLGDLAAEAAWHELHPGKIVLATPGAHTCWLGTPVAIPSQQRAPHEDDDIGALAREAGRWAASYWLS